MSQTKSMKSVLVALALAPPDQIDETMTARITLLVDKSPENVAAGLQAILNECAYASLASDFAMLAMDEAMRFAMSIHSTSPTDSTKH